MLQFWGVMLQHCLLAHSMGISLVLDLYNEAKMHESPLHVQSPLYLVADYLFEENVVGGSRDDIIAISIADLSLALDSASDPIHPK
jgi:hypothetical protein